MAKQRLTERIWTQIDGDVNPGAYGATLARLDGEAIEVLKLQPIREYVGDGEAAEVGFPFWTRTGYYHPSDLDREHPEVQAALAFVGAEDEPELPLEYIASACLDYGHLVEEGPGGWARDVLGRDRVRWSNAGGRAKGWRYLAEEDAEFRRMLKGGV